MNSEYIRLCILCQGEIRKRMGNRPLPGDNLLFLEDPAVQVVGKVSDTEFQVTPGSNGFEWVLMSAYGQMICLPQAIDLQNLERGLLGVALSFVNTVKVEQSVGMCWVRFEHLNGDLIRRGEGTTPEVALLRALMRQWGIEEVKG